MVKPNKMADDFRDWLKKKSFSESTIRNYVGLIKHFAVCVKHFGKLDGEVIKFFLESKDEEYFKIEISRRTFKRRTKPFARYVLRTYLDSIGKPSLKMEISKPRRTEKPKKVVRMIMDEQRLIKLFTIAGGSLSWKEGVVTLVDDDKPDLEKILICRLLYEGAGRVSEVCPSKNKRKVKHLDFTHNSLKVIGKGGKSDIIFFKPRTAKLLKTYIAKRGLSDNDELFLNENPWNVWRWLTLFSEKRLKLRITPHVLRRSCLTHMIQHGATLKQAQDYARHEDPKTTSIYIVLAGKERKETGDKYVPEL